MMKNTFVISLGGSLIVPDEIDIAYLKKFRAMISAQIRQGSRFIISPGGGKTCRKYQAALAQVTKTSVADLDWIGLSTNKFHAKFLQLMFGRSVHKEIAYDPNIKFAFKERILIGAGGWKPGRSSDDFSVRLAKTFGAKTVINLSNINYVYTKDPKKFRNAKKIEQISWQNFFKIIGRKWNPGSNLPFDPVAAKLAQKNKIKVIIANGKNLQNLQHIIKGKKFIGTIIS